MLEERQVAPVAYASGLGTTSTALHLSQFNILKGRAQNSGVDTNFAAWLLTAAVDERCWRRTQLAFFARVTLASVQRQNERRHVILPWFTRRILVCRERSIVRGDEDRIMIRPSSRPEVASPGCRGQCAAKRLFHSSAPACLSLRA